MSGAKHLLPNGECVDMDNFSFTSLQKHLKFHFQYCLDI